MAALGPPSVRNARRERAHGRADAISAARRLSASQADAAAARYATRERGSSGGGGLGDAVRDGDLPQVRDLVKLGIGKISVPSGPRGQQ